MKFVIGWSTVGAVVVLFLRIFVFLYIKHGVMSKKEYQAYSQNKSFLKRWFLLDTEDFCKRKHKGKRRYIHNILNITGAVVIAEHIILLLFIVGLCLNHYRVISDSFMNGIFLFFWCSVLASFGALFYCVNRTY